MKGVVLWLQGLILQLMATTRLGTSTGLDVDSFVADFGLSRLAAVRATGQVTFSRYTPTNQAVVPVGAVVQTADGTQTFAIVADTAQSAYSAAVGGYVLPANTASITATVQAVNPGVQGNISAGVLSVLQTGVSGVDTVTNASAFTNGLDAETDTALKARFVAFINSFSKATLGAIEYAITSYQQGMQYNILENVDYSGATDNGMVTIIVDDGSGSTPSGTVSAVSSVVNATRAAGVRIGVYAAATLAASIAMTIGVAAGYNKAAVAAQVAAAVTAAVNATGLGNTLDFMRLGQAAFDASPGVASVTGVTLNSGTADLVATAKQTIKVTGSVTVNTP